jgi:hypothetical protein
MSTNVTNVSFSFSLTLFRISAILLPFNSIDNVVALFMGSEVRKETKNLIILAEETKPTIITPHTRTGVL